MPHLSVETFVTQYFWLVVFLFTNYILSGVYYLPKLAEVFKTRKNLEFCSNLETIENPLIAKKVISDILKYNSSNINILNLNNNFIKTNQTWINK